MRLDIAGVFTQNEMSTVGGGLGVEQVEYGEPGDEAGTRGWASHSRLQSLGCSLSPELSASKGPRAGGATPLSGCTWCFSGSPVS